MEQTHPIRHLIDQFPTRRILADRIGATTAQVFKWAQFDRIPSEWQQNVVLAAQDIGLNHVTPAWMLRVHAEWPQRHPAGITSPEKVPAQ